MKVVPLTLILLLATFGAMSQPVITQQPTSQITIGGKNASFSVSVSGVEPITYQWRFNDTNNLPLGMITTVAGNGVIVNFNGDGGSATNAAFFNPTGLAMDARGNFFIADNYNHRIRKIDTNGIITTVAGNGTNSFYGDGGAATNAALNYPNSVAVDTNDNLFIADEYNHRIRKVDANGIITTVAGNGTQSFSGDGGKATDAPLSEPKDVGVDSNGNLFIADTGNGRIRRVDANGIITTITGVGSKCIAVDAGGNVFVAPYYGRNVYKVDTNGMISIIAGNGGNSSSGDGGAATNASLSYDVRSLAVDSRGNLFIADDGNGSRIRMVNTNGIITTVAGGGPWKALNIGSVATNASLNFPAGLVADANGNLIIADTYNLCIRKVTNSVMTTIAGGGSSFPGDGGAATNAGLWVPTGVAFDAGGNMLIADARHHCIRKVNTNGIITTIVGNGKNSFSGDGGAATNAGLSSPSRIMSDAGGNLFISDHSNNRVRKVDANGIITTIAGNGDPSYYGDGQVATHAALNNPGGLATDGNGNLFIADSFNNRIRKVATNGIITTFAGGGSNYTINPTNATLVYLSYIPYAIEVDAKGNVFFGGGPSIKMVETNGMISDFLYRFPFSSFSTIGSLALDPSGNMFVTDNGSNRICKINTNGLVTAIAGNATRSFSGDGGDATIASLSLPNDAALDAYGNVFIADTGNDRIRKFSSRGLPLLTVESASVAKSGNYSVIVSNASGSVTSSVASLTVIPGIFTQQPTNQVVPLSSNASFNVVVAGPTAMNYQWVFYDSLTTAGATAQAPFGWVMSTTVTNGGSGYGTVPQVQFIGGGGSGAKGTAVVSNGVIVRVNMNNMGSGYSTPPTVQIAAPTGIRLVNQTNSLLTLFSVTATNAGNYYVLVTNNFSNMASSAARLTVTPAGYNQIGAQVFDNSTILLSFVGLAGLNYALDRSFTLSPADWIPQTTNPADVNGILIFTNTPDSTTNNFWRVCSVP